MLKRGKTALPCAQAQIGSAQDIRLTARCAMFFLGISLLILTGLFVWPNIVARGIFIGFALISLVLTFSRFVALCLFAKGEKMPASPAGITQDAFPVLTILLPLYQEAHMVKRLTHYVSRINWPVDKLEVFLICEPDDITTIIEARRLIRPPFKLFITTGNAPRTKPNALNQALRYACGEIVTIFDAEDIPHPDQPRQALSVFLANPACGAVQAPLTYYNPYTSWISRQFTLEYDVLFQIWNPALAHFNLPFPLGGTSNYIRRAALNQCGGWDAFNVTEDADLSFRLSTLGWNIGCISLPTHEEAVTRWRAWRKQRTRWIKGYMQSWLVHMRRPWKLGPSALKRQATLQLTLGLSIICALFHLPSIIIMAILMFVSRLECLQSLPFTLGLICLGLSYIISIVMGMSAALHMRRPRLIIHSFFMPLYWLLMFLPAWQALTELWSMPFYWNKTQHGVIAPPDSLKTS